MLPIIRFLKTYHHGTVHGRNTLAIRNEFAIVLQPLHAVLDGAYQKRVRGLAKARTVCQQIEGGLQGFKRTFFPDHPQRQGADMDNPLLVFTGTGFPAFKGMGSIHPFSQIPPDNAGQRGLIR